jgi:hypothetical protein
MMWEIISQSNEKNGFEKKNLAALCRRGLG